MSPPKTPNAPAVETEAPSNSHKETSVTAMKHQITKNEEFS